MKNYILEKEQFKKKLQEFTNTLASEISCNNEWTIKGFIDVFKNIYTTIYFYNNHVSNI